MFSVTHSRPSIAAYSGLSTSGVSLDITDILATEVRWIVVSIGRLTSKTWFAPLAMAGGFSKPLFEQQLAKLSEVGHEGRSESALDILSLPVLITPSLTIDFKYFDPEVRRRFESICEETLTSRPGALPFKVVLSDRYKQRAMPMPQVARLPGEDSIREIWK